MDLIPESKDRVIALLRQGICPLCGGSFIKPLYHINKAHGITAKELKDRLLIPRSVSFIPDELRELNRQNAIKHNFKRNLIPGGTNAKLDEPTKKKMSLKRSENIKNNPTLIEIINKKSVVRISGDGAIKVYDSIANAIRDKENTSNIYHCVTRQRPDKNGNRWVLLKDFEKGD